MHFKKLKLRYDLNLLETIRASVASLRNYLKDYVTLKFRNGSQFDVVGALDSTRGGRRHGGLIDEARKKCMKIIYST